MVRGYLINGDVVLELMKLGSRLRKTSAPVPSPDFPLRVTWMEVCQECSLLPGTLKGVHGGDAGRGLSYS